MDVEFGYFARIMEDELNELDDGVFWHTQVVILPYLFYLLDGTG
jgi:hypothetical protein